MADIKWIKIRTDIFDNRKIKQIEALPEGDSIIVIWYKLLCLAGTINDSGAIYLTRDLPYTDDMLSIAFNRPLDTIKLALATFLKFNMIEIAEDIIYVSNWEKYQNIDGMEKVREQNRIRKANQRAREKSYKTAENNADNVTGHVTVTQSHATDKNKKEDKEEEKNKKEDKEYIDTNVSCSNERPKCTVIDKEVLEVFNYWNSKGIIVHAKIVDKLLKQIVKVLKENSVEEIKACIDRYDTVVKDQSYYFDTKWTLLEFLKQENAMNDFKEDGSKWIKYINSRSGKKAKNKSMMENVDLSAFGVGSGGFEQ